MLCLDLMTTKAAVEIVPVTCLPLPKKQLHPEKQEQKACVPAGKQKMGKKTGITDDFPLPWIIIITEEANCNWRY